jgi:hypothetical protein
MKIFLIGQTLALLVMAGLASYSTASDVFYVRPTTCEPGYQIIEERGFQTVIRTVCKVVPDTQKIKKIVYSTKEQPFCLPAGSCGPNCFNSCPTQPACCPPICRLLLVKKEVVSECPSWKCVVEQVPEQVPCTIYKKVPITQAVPRGSQPAVLGSPR